MIIVTGRNAGDKIWNGIKTRKPRNLGACRHPSRRNASAVRGVAEHVCYDSARSSSRAITMCWISDVPS